MENNQQAAPGFVFDSEGFSTRIYLFIKYCLMFNSVNIQKYNMQVCEDLNSTNWVVFCKEIYTLRYKGIEIQTAGPDDAFDTFYLYVTTSINQLMDKMIKLKDQGLPIPVELASGTILIKEKVKELTDEIDELLKTTDTYGKPSNTKGS